MKQKILYNKMLRFYHRSKGKLKRLSASGKNRRKQDILRRRIVRLFDLLKSMQPALKKSAAAVVLSGSLMLFQSSTVQGQITFTQVSDNPFVSASTSGYSSPAFADLDNDGDLDLLVGDYEGGFYYFQNTGTNTTPVYAAPVVNPFGLDFIGYNSSPSFADLDHDGDQDILAGDNSGNFFYFQNTGTNVAPAFASAISNSFGLADIGSFSTPAFADLDHDGDMDILAGEYDGDLFYFQNTGTNIAPAFASQATNPFGLTNIGYNSNPALADLDNDGDLDLLVGEYQGQIFYFQNTGNNVAPVYASSVQSPFGLSAVGYYAAPSFADVDHDGDLDILAGEGSGALIYFQNIGTNTAPVYKKIPSGPYGLLGNGGYSAPAFADLDNDGDQDMLAGEYLGHFLYLQNTGTNVAPAFAQGMFDPFSLTAIGNNSTPAFGDLDNDGDMDILSGDALGDFHYLQNTGTNSAPVYASGVINPFGLTVTGNSNAPALADLDHDGDLDILSGDASGAFHYFQNIGTNTSPAFAADVVDTFGLTVIGYYSTPAFADLDKDGDLDILSGEGLGNLFYFQNTGSNISPSFAAALSNPFGFANVGIRSAPSFVDLDHDGDLDMLSGSGIGDFYYFRNTSLINSVENGIKFSSTTINLFPNPTHDILSVDITSKVNQKCNIRLMDMVGKQLMFDSFKLAEGSNLHSYVVSSYAKGMYMFVLEREGMPSETIRVVVE